eukprot:gnl/MRDRNA2_/MRDRNA2_87737_c0_seq1.p1 gnl/MRDRNA2_/MRDRNA2_87737_c0~~gnl/MRDRNA2_/MRDRNA2_87737_c0_seq1.p1  ORF type:complete len:387 (+),score=85.17 gnl/MRDRNA2_/MRDRNA2_87737_c0_seq1:53-1213(+)
MLHCAGTSMLCIRLCGLLFLCTAWRCHCNSSSVNGTAAKVSSGNVSQQATQNSSVNNVSKEEISKVSVVNASKVDTEKAKEEASDTKKPEDAVKGTTNATTEKEDKKTIEKVEKEDQGQEKASDADTAEDVKAADAEAPDSTKTTPPAELSNGTTTQTTTTQAVWRRPTTTTTIYTPAPADATQTWLSKEDPCLVACKEPVERVFGRGPLPATDSATFAVKMMTSCRTMMDFLKCVRDPPDAPDACPANGDVVQSVEFYTAMCMCPCRDSFVRGLRKAHENREANMCVNFEDFAGCAACASQREECEYALVDTKTEVAGRLLEAASACPTASCTGYLWQWQPKSASSSVISAGAGAADDAGGAAKTFGEMSCTALYLLLGFWVFWH